MKKIVYILALSMLSLFGFAQKESDNVRVGNKLYKAEKYTEAEIEYRKGLLKNPKSFEANYNLGNALFKQKKYPEALEQFTKSIELKPSEKEKLAAAFHNTGNALFADKKIQESIDAYKKALKYKPADNDTRYNLAYAQEMLKKQQAKDKNKPNQKEDEADKIKEKADELVSKRRYKEAYELMKEAEKINKSVLKYKDFTNRILEVVNLN